jgi:hypothetical protein
MPFITFIYRIGPNKKFFYGKYVCDDISDDHEGLDNEILPTVIDGINEYRKQKGLSKLLNKNFSLGILSFSTNIYIPTDSSDNEIECFDFYHKSFIYRQDETYVNGKLLKNNNNP